MIRITYEVNNAVATKDFAGDRWACDAEQVVVMKNDEPAAMIPFRRVIVVELIVSEASA